ncbi:MAG TPA: hypothetical protein VFQ70_00720 [Candidatus Saccharimonadaceae bacterium]|nr:hypothetical protein [Candidatus Saccharimonadaceae bacterium]
MSVETRSYQPMLDPETLRRAYAQRPYAEQGDTSWGFVTERRTRRPRREVSNGAADVALQQTGVVLDGVQRSLDTRGQ